VGEFWRILANCGSVTIRHAANREITHKKLRPANLISAFRILISVFLSAGFANFFCEVFMRGCIIPRIAASRTESFHEKPFFEFWRRTGQPEIPGGRSKRRYHPTPFLISWPATIPTTTAMALARSVSRRPFGPPPKS
jgi:hypothetical protein